MYVTHSLSELEALREGCIPEWYALDAYQCLPLVLPISLFFFSSFFASYYFFYIDLLYFWFWLFMGTRFFL